MSMTIHPASAAEDHTPAIRKNGLNAIVQIANGVFLKFSTAGMAMRNLPGILPDYISFSERAIAGRGEWYLRYRCMRLR
jgi:hypothetical protein